MVLPGLPPIFRAKWAVLLFVLASLGMGVAGRTYESTALQLAGSVLFMLSMPLYSYFSLKGMCQLLTGLSDFWALTIIYFNTWSVGFVGFLAHNHRHRIAVVSETNETLQQDALPSQEELEAGDWFSGGGGKAALGPAPPAVTRKLWSRRHG